MLRHRTNNILRPLRRIPDRQLLSMECLHRQANEINCRFRS